MEYESAIGPFGGGWHTWTMLLGQQGLTAVAYSAKDSIKFGFNQQLGFPKDPHLGFRNRVNEGSGVTIPSRVRRMDFELAAVKSICGKIRQAQNQIIIETVNGDAKKFIIWDRAQTERYFEMLKSLYGQIYTEEGKPTTRLGKIMKS